MKAFHQFGIVMLLLVSYLTPAMACMLPGAQMTTEERACCRMMHAQCEQMGMPASHGCCQKASHSTLDRALVTKATNYHPVAVAVAFLTVSEWLQPSLATSEWVNGAGYSPPQFPPGSNSVLRI